MKTTDEIYAEMKAAYGAATGLALNDGGDMAIRLYASAAQLSSLWAQADFVARQSFPQTAEGRYLDYHAEVRGLCRVPSAKASGTIRFHISAALPNALNIPANVSCMTAAETVFVTKAAGVIAAGQLYCDVPAEAAEAGAGGNAPANSVIYMALAPTGVSSCSNPGAFTGGAAAEGDESLRRRVLRSYKTLPNGANAAYYEGQALDTEGVAAVTILPKNRGLGTVDVVISAPSGLPAQSLINAVKAKLDAQREICVDIAVSAPTTVTVPVTAALKAAPGYTYAGVSAAVQTALGSYFNGERLGKNVLRAKLGSIIYSVPGVQNYTLTAPAADVTVNSTQLPVLGTITITVMA